MRLAPCAVLTVPARFAPTATPAAGEQQWCVVCSLPSPHLICEPCRAIVRGDAVGKTAGRPGR